MSSTDYDPIGDLQRIKKLSENSRYAEPLPTGQWATECSLRARSKMQHITWEEFLQAWHAKSPLLLINRSSEEQNAAD